MFAALHARVAGVAPSVAVARAFTPRFQAVGPVVLLDVAGLSRLFGGAEEIGAQLFAQVQQNLRAEPPCGTPVRNPRAEPPCGTPVRNPRAEPACAVASTATAAMLLALGRPGLTVVAPGDEPAALAVLPVGMLGEFERVRLEHSSTPDSRRPTPDSRLPTPDSRLLIPDSRKYSTGGWSHPRSAHPAQQTRRLRARVQEALTQGSDLLRTLKRWGIHTLGDLAVLPAPDVYERLGPRGVAWQHLARGEDDGPLVPWVDEAPFEATMDLEWPIEGLEPLSFVLARLLEPLAARLEQADRGAAVLHTSLRLTTKTTHVRSLQLPAPMRDAKTLRTLLLLDLETHPPAAAVDRVSVLIEPTPARVLQWTLYDRAEPAPEQVSTLLARLTALMGEGHVGSPRLVDTWKPGAFEMAAFTTARRAGPDAHAAHAGSRGPVDHPGVAPACALRRFRLPIPVRVKVEEGRPVRVTTDRHGVSGGAIVQSAGPWRTSGAWWDAEQVGLVGKSFYPPHQPHQSHLPHASAWDRDEWDVAMRDGTVYRLSVEREVGQWFLEGVVD